MNSDTVLPKLRLTRRIASRLEQVDQVCHEIRRLFCDGALRPLTFPVELVARECLNNAVIHGNSRQPHKQVRFQLRCALGRVCLRVRDEGPGFDWRAVEWNASGNTVKTAGRGLPILASYAERIRFNRPGNQVTLWLRFEHERI